MDHDPRLASAIADAMAQRYFGKYRGQVVDNRDPEGLARLQVVVPALLQRAAVWAMPCVPYAGDGIGLFALPPIGAAVWVEFEGGDMDYPIWAGCFWRRPWKSRQPEGGLSMTKTSVRSGKSLRRPASLAAPSAFVMTALAPLSRSR